MTTHISIQPRKLSRLFRAVDEGRFAIPKLQREFVWDGPKAARLLDSVVKGMPIGALMIWQAQRKERLHLRQTYQVLPAFNPTHPQVWFLMDGQQRVSVLHHVRNGTKLVNAKRREIDFSRVVLSLTPDDSGVMVTYRKPHGRDFVSLSDILSSGWRHRFHGLPKRLMARVASARKAILEYRLILVFHRAPIKEVRETFLRINTQGMRITTADAIFARAEEINLRDIVHEVRDQLDSSFRDVPEPPVLFAMAAACGGREVRGEGLERELRRVQVQAMRDPRTRASLERTWRELRTCFGKAVDYLRETFKVVNRGFLYSDYMIAVLALFYFHSGGRGPNRFQRDQLQRWFWATAVGARYSGKSFGRCIGSDLEYMQRLAGGRRVKFEHEAETERAEVRRAQYSDRSGLTAAFYSLLLLHQPVSIIDAGLNVIPLERYATAANRKDRHHIFPVAALSACRLPLRDVHSIANICLLTADENQSVGRRAPKSYLGRVRVPKRMFAAKMRRHLIPHDETSGIWSSDLRSGYRRFVKQRCDLICRTMEQEAGIKLFRSEKSGSRRTP